MVIVVTPVLRMLQGRQPFQRDPDHYRHCRRRRCRECAAYAQNLQYQNGPQYPNMGQNFNPGPNYYPGPNVNPGPNFNPGPNYNGNPNFTPNYNGSQNSNAPPSYQRYPPGQMSGSARDIEPSQSSSQGTETSYPNEKDPVRNSNNPYAEGSSSGSVPRDRVSASNAQPEQR